MKVLTTLLFLFLNFLQCNAQSISTVEYLGKEYLLFPESQDEKYMNDLTYWKENVIREKYKLDWKQNIDGQWIQFYKNNDSIPAKIFELKKTKLNGEYKLFYENGKIETIENYINEKRVGLKTNFYKSGKIRDSVIYRLDTAQNGHIFSNKIFLKTFYENGNYKKIQTFDSLGVKNGKWVDFYENGQVKIEQQYTNKNIDLRNSANKNSYGNRIEKYKYFYPNGQIKFSLNYSNDKIDSGLFVEYYSSGQKKISGNLKNGLRDSEWTEYYENGKIKSKGNYSSGSYTVCGVVPFTDFYEYKVGEWSYYFVNGKIKANGIYEIKTKNVGTNCKGGANLNCGILTKEWTFYKADGNPISLKNVLENELIENQEILRKRVYKTE